MTRHVWVAMTAALALGALAGCGTNETKDPTPQAGPDAGHDGPEDSGTSELDAGTGGRDDAGTDAGEEPPGPGPWPVDAVTHYSATYGIDSLQSVGVDDAQNIWLLDGARIGVLRPGTTSPVWTNGIGQAALGFSEEGLALGSTVICGGAANQAYVGYWHRDANQGELLDSSDPRFSKGDLDVVQVNGDGTVSLVEHLHRSTGTSTPWPPANTGIRNSNNWTLNEDVSVLVCQKVMRGRDKGEVYIGTNHGVTRIRGLDYSSHRHPIAGTMDNPLIGYSYGLGIAQNGDVLIANEWMVGMVEPPEALGDWEFFGPAPAPGAPWLVNAFNHELNSETEMDFWRAFQQTTDGQYYLGSSTFGLWRMERTQWVGSPNWFKLSGLPSESINALAATDDGSLFIGTDDAGLWRMDAQKNLTRFEEVPGDTIRELIYDPTVVPAALYVITEGQLYVLRGY